MEKRELLHMVGGNEKLVWPLCKIVCRSLQQLKIELAYDPEIPLLGIAVKEMKSICQRHI
jgi:hypothetical protein